MGFVLEAKPARLPCRNGIAHVMPEVEQEGQACEFDITHTNLE